MSQNDTEKKQIRLVLAQSDSIRAEFYKIYHNGIFEKKPFNYDDLKGNDKMLEDAIRTAFFSGFHACEDFYELQKITDFMNEKKDAVSNAIKMNEGNSKEKCDADDEKGWSVGNFLCDGRSVSGNCLKFSRLKECRSCGLFLCKNCYAEHREEVENDD